MNWVSALDLIPLVTIILCAVDQLRQVVAHRQPLIAGLLAFVAVFAFYLVARIIHGAVTPDWMLLLDWVVSMLFGFQTLTFNPKDSGNEFGESDSHIA